MNGQRGILLTLPDGTQSSLSEPARRVVSTPPETGVQFDADELERGRSRVKATRRMSNDKSTSTSRSTSRARANLLNEQFLKWTVLRRDPSMRLQGESLAESDDSSSDSKDSSSVMEEVSDEEQVSDVENDLEIDEQMQYDMGARVLPNYAVNISQVLATASTWICENEKNEKNDNDGTGAPRAQYSSLPGGYSRAVQLLSRGRGATTTRNFILCTDLSTESQYALAYVVGAVANNGDTLYVLHWDGKNVGTSRDQLLRNVAAMRQQVLHKLDCAAAALVDLDVMLLSLTHPYPKHLLSELIYAFKPVALCCSLSLVLTTLQNFVCSVPTLVIRKKLKRSRRKGISE